MKDAAQTPDPMDPHDAKIARLEAFIEELRHGGKRKTAPFSRALPKPIPKNPDETAVAATARLRLFARSSPKRLKWMPFNCPYKTINLY